jgi:DNA-binding response OmpR family regulator
MAFSGLSVRYGTDGCAEGPYLPSMTKHSVTDAAIVIFVVEDEILIQKALSDALTDGGFTVRSAGRGDEALDIIAAEGETFRAIITDINLPGVSGWDVARRAREMNDQMPIVYMTGGSANDWASNGVPNSVLLTKPFAAAQMITAVSQLITNASTG